MLSTAYRRAAARTFHVLIGSGAGKYHACALPASQRCTPGAQRSAVKRHSARLGAQNPVRCFPSLVQRTCTASYHTDSPSEQTTSSSSQPLSSSDSRPSFKARLQGGERLYGGFCMSASPIVADVMASAGFDYVVIDMEHGPGDYMDTQQQLWAVRARAGGRCAVMVRLATNDATAMKKVLDMGPDAVLVPMVNSPSEATAAAQAAAYPPQGIRGAAYPLVGASGYGTDAGYAATCREELLVLVQIETPEAVAGAEDIAAVEGVDGLFIGPFDLSANMGHLGDPGHADVAAAVQRTEIAAAKQGKLLGGFVSPGKSANEMFASGYNLVGGCADVGLLRDAALANLAAVDRH